MANREQLLQDSYFPYDVSNIVKKSFITDLKKFLAIFCSMTYFKEKEGDLIDLISLTNTYPFSMERDTTKNFMELQIAKVTGQPAEIVDKKIHSFAFMRIEKKKKKRNGCC